MRSGSCLNRNDIVKDSPATALWLSVLSGSHSQSQLRCSGSAAVLLCCYFSPLQKKAFVLCRLDLAQIINQITAYL